jgi:flagellar assembly factor FliW
MIRCNQINAVGESDTFRQHSPIYIDFLNFHKFHLKQIIRIFSILKAQMSTGKDFLLCPEPTEFFVKTLMKT